MKGTIEKFFYSSIFKKLRAHHYKVGYEQGRFDQAMDQLLKTKPSEYIDTFNIDEKVVQKYKQQCPVSTQKCKSNNEIEYKIFRAILTGRVSRNENGQKHINYYRNCFVVEGNRVVDLYYDRENYWYVKEHVKEAFDRKNQKLFV